MEFTSRWEKQLDFDCTTFSIPDLLENNQNTNAPLKLLQPFKMPTSFTLNFCIEIKLIQSNSLTPINPLLHLKQPVNIRPNIIPQHFALFGIAGIFGIFDECFLFCQIFGIFCRILGISANNLAEKFFVLQKFQITPTVADIRPNTKLFGQIRNYSTEQLATWPNIWYLPNYLPLESFEYSYSVQLPSLLSTDKTHMENVLFLVIRGI